MANGTISEKADNEHILVCLSASPSNKKIVETAAKMASAFGGYFSALYVQTPNSDKMDDESRHRLQSHIRTAEQFGANIITVYGEDIAAQIAEYARISGVTKIILGRSKTRRRHFWNKSALSEKLAVLSPNLDIFIIPDSKADSKYKEISYTLLHRFIPYPKDLPKLLFILILATLFNLFLYRLGFTDSNIIPVYILGVLLTSLFTRGYFCGILGSFLSVTLFNFFFTEPRFTFHAYGSKYTVTFAIMLAASVITGTLASKLKYNAKQSAQAAFRTKVLLDTNQLLQKAKDNDEIINITATQLVKLLKRSVVIYSADGGVLSKGSLFPADSQDLSINLFDETEHDTVQWVFKNRQRAGATTEIMSSAKCMYTAIQINNYVYGAVGVHISAEPLESFENSMLVSILGECALALDNNRNEKEKELAAVLAKNEQLRANLLRTISHDLRTPLTSISGNASNLLSNYEKLDEETTEQIFTDIFDDSQWLISLVENLLSVTRIEQGRLESNMSIQLMDEVIEEALKHVSRKKSEHVISVDCSDEILLARM
ncbi:MAG: DUF4118 domain-containing protein, partial [Clostridia bacterium]|nr:DUF4118 domain-containing protein [Clostridia bacterium]